MNSVGKHLLRFVLYREQEDFYWLTKQGYLLMHLLTANLVMRL